MVYAYNQKLGKERERGREGEREDTV